MYNGDAAMAKAYKKSFMVRHLFRGFSSIVLVMMATQQIQVEISSMHTKESFGTPVCDGQKYTVVQVVQAEISIKKIFPQKIISRLNKSIFLKNVLVLLTLHFTLTVAIVINNLPKTISCYHRHIWVNLDLLQWTACIRWIMMEKALSSTSSFVMNCHGILPKLRGMGFQRTLCPT